MRLTEFELFCWNWFNKYFNQFTMDANLMGGLIKELSLDGKEKELFLKSLNMIYVNFLKIQNEVAEKKMKKKRN